METKINYIIIKRYGESGGFHIYKAYCTKEEAIQKMKISTGEEPHDFNGTLIWEDECDFETMITSSLLMYRPIDNIREIAKEEIV